MPLPEQSVLQDSDILAQQRNPGFETENLPSPDGFTMPQVAPIAVPGTGQVQGDQAKAYLDRFNADILSTPTARDTPGTSPIFTAADVYNPRYKTILPGEDTEEAYAQGQSSWDRVANGIVKMGAIGVGSFIGTLTSLPFTASSVGGDSVYNRDSLSGIDKWVNSFENDFPNYYTKWEQEHPFKSAIPFSGGFANFLGDKFIKNLGFTAGAIGGAVVQNMALGALTGGLGAVPGAAASFGRIALALQKIFTGADKAADLVQLGVQAGRSGEQLLKLERLVQAAAGKKAIDGVKFGLNLYGASASEAGFEGRSQYDAVKTDLMHTYQQANGYSATGKDLEDIEKYAESAANVTFAANMALLTVSNFIQFDTFLKPFTAAKGGMKATLQREIANGQKIALKEGSRDVFERSVPKTFGGRIWNAVRPAGPAILTEGIYEEGGQFAATVATENYYERKFLHDKGIDKRFYEDDETEWDSRSQIANIIHSVKEGAKAEFTTDEGLENVFIGSLTGAAFAGVGSFMSRNQSRQQVDATAKMLNTNGVTGIFGNNAVYTANAIKIAEDMKAATRSNDPFKYKNFQHEQFVNFITSGVRAGRFDVRMDQLDMLKDMTPEEFKKSFGLDYSQSNLQTVSEYVETLKDKAKSIKKISDLIDGSFSNPYSFNPNAKTPEEIEQNDKANTFNFYKDDLIRLASINSDTATRLAQINDSVVDLSPNMTIDNLGKYTTDEYYIQKAKGLKEEIKNLQKGIDDKTTSSLGEDQRKIKSLQAKVDLIDKSRSSPDPKKVRELFETMINYDLNNGTDEIENNIPKEAVDQLLLYSADTNRLKRYKDQAYEAFEKLSSEEGFNKYFADTAKAKEAFRKKQEEAATKKALDARLTATPVTPTEPEEKKEPKKEDKVTIKTEDGKETKVDKEIAVTLTPDADPEVVKVIEQTDEGVVVEKEDGTQVTITPEEATQEDPLGKQLEEAGKEDNGDKDTPPPPSTPRDKVGEPKKDVAFAPLTTTDPPYNNKTTPDANFNIRHQNFLFNLGSTDPKVFKQENKSKLRIIPVNAQTASQFGFPADWIPEGTNADNSPIRTVYIVDKRDSSKPKTSSDIFYVDQNGNELGRVGDPVDPSLAIYSNFTTTDFTFNGEARYSNKNNLDEEEVKNWWRKERAKLLSISSKDNTPIFQFDVSRGHARSMTTGVRNKVTDAGLIREEDLGNSVITIATEGNIAIFGAYDQDGGGIGAHKQSVNMPIGTPLLNFGGNLTFLNNRTLTPEEANNIFDLIKILGDRRSTENKSAIFKYLNKVVHLANPKEGIQPSKNSITIAGAFITLGHGSPIHMSANSLEKNKEAILEFLGKTFHSVNVSELNRIKKDPKATDLQFSELSVKDSKVVTGSPWKTYNHYLLSARTPEGKRRDVTPLSVNTALPQENEVPIVGKYAVVKNEEFNESNFKSTAKPAPKPKPAAPADGGKKGREQGTKEAADGITIIDIVTPTKTIHLGFKVTSRDTNGNITDIEPVGVVDEEGNVTPFKDPAAVKADILQRIKDSTVKQDETNRKPEKKAVEPIIGLIHGIDYKAASINDGKLVIAYREILDDTGKVIDVEPFAKLMESGDLLPFADPVGASTQLGPLILSQLGIGQEEEKQENPAVQTPPKTETPEPKTGPTRDANDDDDLDGNFTPTEDSQFRLMDGPHSSYVKADIEKESAEFKRILGDTIPIHVVDRMLRTTGGGLAWGALADSAVFIYNSAEVGTLYHEAFEAVWFHFATGAEQQALYDEFINRKGTFKTFDGRTINFSDASIKEAKEQMAEEFRNFKLLNKLPGQKKQRNFFQMILDFIKRIFLGDPSEVNKMFKKINKGYYRNYPTIGRSMLEPQYREQGLDQFSEMQIQDTIQGMTAEMFTAIFKDNASIISQLETHKGVGAAGIYDNLKDRLEFYFTDTTANTGTLRSEFGLKYQAATTAEDKEAIKEQRAKIKDLWANISANWDQFVKEHKRYLKVFNVEFTVNDDGDIDFADNDFGVDENKSQSEYARDIFTIDAKNNASNKVKLLFATLADSEWVKSATEASIGAARNSQIRMKREDSTLALPKLASYAKLFNYVLHNTANTNGLYDMWNKMKGLTQSESRKKIDANLQRLMNRMNFDKGFEGKTIDEVKLLLSTENALAKQKPSFFRQFVDHTRRTFFKSTVTNSKINQIKELWIANIKGSGMVAPLENKFIFKKDVIGIADNIEFLNKIGIGISKADVAKLKGANITRFNEAVNTVKSLIEKAAKERTAIPVLSSKQLDFDTRLNAIAEFYTNYMVGEDTQSQHTNLDSEPTSNFVLNNFVSTVLSDANNSDDLAEFLAKKDNGYFSDVFHEDSLILQRMFAGEDGTRTRTVELGIVEGRETWDQNNKSASTLTEAERQVYEINNNLNGVFYTLLPADAKSEWAIRVGTYYSPNKFFGDDSERGNEITKFGNQMYKWLQSEVALAQDYENRKNISALNRKYDKNDAKRTVGNSLRFFGDILPKAIVDRIHTEVIDGGADLSTVISDSEMRAQMNTYIRSKANKTMDNLIDWQVLGKRGKGNEVQYRLNGFDRSFIDANIKKNQEWFSEAEAVRLLAFREMNYVTNNIEMHKFFFGDPAQYKDELKRIKSFLSGREAMHVDTIETSEGFDQWANDSLNRVNDIKLAPSDPGYQAFKSHSNTATLLDVIFESEAIEEIEAVLGTKADPYKEGNEADAQAHITGTAYREIMYKSGARFTAAQEEQFQWEMAWERNHKHKNGTYDGYKSNSALQKADNELLRKLGPDGNTDVAFPVLKLMHSGIQTVDGRAVVSLDKASWSPLFFRWTIRGGAETSLTKLHDAMQKRGIDYVRMESAHKVGIQADSTINMYDKDGNFNSNDLLQVQPEQIPHKHFGIQVEQSKKDKGQTEGSQARKIVPSDLKSNGVPVDFMTKYANQQEARTAWNALTYDQQISESPIFAKIERHDAALQNLTNIRTDRALKKLGVELTDKGLTITDKAKVSEYLLNELERRELPRNIAAGLEIDPETNDFAQPLEANAQYSKIRAVLYSIIERTVIRPKVNGGQKTMVSVAGMETGSRIVKRMVNGKPVFTSNELKFYTQGENGTMACEVMVPYWFGKKLMEAGSGRTKAEVIDYLMTDPEGQKLLEGIGFRIPTQGLNSIDFFVVKDFLPEQMGDVIVLPSEITVKAGSDFDIDKLNTYLMNWYVNKDSGMPSIIQYKGDRESTLQYLKEISLNPRQIRQVLEDTPGVDKNDAIRSIWGNRDINTLDTLYEQSLENEYFASIKEILALKENFSRLILPNDASELKGYRNKIKALKGDDAAGLGTYSRLLDSTYMMKERQAYMSSKQVVGTSAVSQTAHAVAQNIPNGVVVTDAKIIVRFDHNTVGNSPSLSDLYTKGTKNLISNINSQTTDGGVDVAKDKFLAEMGINQDTLGTFLTMVRMGIKPWSVVLFLNQPIIQEFLKLKAIGASVSAINPSVIKVPDYLIRKKLYSKYGGIAGKKDKRLSTLPAKYTDKMMEEMLQKKNLSMQDNILQVGMLHDYMDYSSIGWDLFKFYQGYNWDTARLNDPNVIRMKQVKFEAANQLKITPVREVMTSFVGSMRDNVLRLDEALRSLINVQSGAAASILSGLTTDLMQQRGLREVDRQQILLNAELSLLDYSIHNNTKINGNSLNAYTEAMILGEKSVARYVDALKKSDDKKLANNPFLQNLVVTLDTREGYPSTVALAERDFETYTSNVWTDAFRELRDDNTVISIDNNPNNDRTVAQIYKNLVLLSMLQTGSKKTGRSFTHLIPNESYAPVVRDAVQNLNLENYYENDVLYRTNWVNNSLVPIAEPEDMSDPRSVEEPRYEHVFLTGAGVRLAETLGGKRPPLLLSPQTWKYGDKKALKIVNVVRDPQTNVVISRNVMLFVRVDVDTINGFAPLTVGKKGNRLVFKQITPWGDNNIVELNASSTDSKLATNVNVNEVSNEAVVSALLASGSPVNASESYIRSATTQETDEDGNEGSNDIEDDGDIETIDPVDPNPIIPSSPGANSITPTPESSSFEEDEIEKDDEDPNQLRLFQGSFETFKNQLVRKDCK